MQILLASEVGARENGISWCGRLVSVEIKRCWQSARSTGLVWVLLGYPAGFEALRSNASPRSLDVLLPHCLRMFG